MPIKWARTRSDLPRIRPCKNRAGGTIIFYERWLSNAVSSPVCVRGVFSNTLLCERLCKSSSVRVFSDAHTFTHSSRHLALCHEPLEVVALQAHRASLSLPAWQPLERDRRARAEAMGCGNSKETTTPVCASPAAAPLVRRQRHPRAMRRGSSCARPDDLRHRSADERLQVRSLMGRVALQAMELQ